MAERRSVSGTRATGSRALLIALGVDSVGTGVFLPISLLYLTRIIGLPIEVAGVLVSVATAAGLVVPPIAGHLVDRWGSRAVVVAAQFVQAAGALSYLFANGAGSAFLGAFLLAMGQRLFYCAVFTLIADVETDPVKDRSFAMAGVMQSTCFGLGALVAALLLDSSGSWAYRLVAGLNVVSFLLCAALLACFVRPGPHTPSAKGDKGFRLLLSDRPYLALIAVNTAFALCIDFFVLGLPLYVASRLDLAGWVIGLLIAISTALRLGVQVPVLRAVGSLPRTRALGLAGAVWVAWCLLSAGALLVPRPWLVPYLIVAVMLFSLASTVHVPVSNALSEASAPAVARGRYVAAFQYSFTISNISAPALGALFVLGSWVPWVVLAALVAIATLSMPLLQRRLPKSSWTVVPSRRDHVEIRRRARSAPDLAGS